MRPSALIPDSNLHIGSCDVPDINPFPFQVIHGLDTFFHGHMIEDIERLTPLYALWTFFELGQESGPFVIFGVGWMGQIR